MRLSLTRMLAVVAVAAGLGGCGASSSSAGRPLVVASENFWGAVAKELAGPRLDVQSIIANPNTDPHSYEPTAADARLLARSRLAIVNGVGYDPWATQLLAANPAASRVVLNVGDVVGAHTGDNPHRWYDPADVERVVAAIVADYKRLEPDEGTYFDRRARAFTGSGLASYRALIKMIRSRYAGVPVGASESIFALQAPALGLDLRTPYGYMKAISEGTDPSAQDKQAVDRQITGRQIKVWIYNAQNATPDIQRLNAEARAAGIPIVTVTETLTPASASFEAWQAAQLRALAAALHSATGR